MTLRKDIKRFAKESWSVSWPMTLIMLIEFIIGITDIYIAGRLGKEIQATYGFVVQFYMIFVIIGNAVTTGTVAVVSRLFTSGDERGLSRSVATSMLLALIAGVTLGLGGMFFTKEIILLVNIPPELKPHVITLGRIYAAGLIFHYLLISTNGILRASRKIFASLKTMSIVCVLNVGFNFIIVFHTSAGFKGIALSTVISVFCGAVINLCQVRSLISFPLRYSTSIAKKIVGIGWPVGVLQALWQLNTMAIILILSSIPRNSVEILAAFATGVRLESAIFLPAFAFHMANAVIIGNLLGEKKQEDAFKGGIATALMGVGIVFLLTIIVVISSCWVVPFLSDNGIVITEARRYIMIIMLGEPFMAWAMILGGALNGAGDTKAMLANVSFSTWLARVPLAYLFVVVLGFGATSVWWAINLSHFVLACLITRRYMQKRWLTLPFLV